MVDHYVHMCIHASVHKAFAIMLPDNFLTQFSNLIKIPTSNLAAKIVAVPVIDCMDIQIL